jgi:hypothetical protein
MLTSTMWGGGGTRGFNALAESAHNVDPRGIGRLPCCDDVALRECEFVCEVESVTRCLCVYGEYPVNKMSNASIKVRWIIIGTFRDRIMRKERHSWHCDA